MSSAKRKAPHRADYHPFKAGDLVEFESHYSQKVFRGRIEAFLHTPGKPDLAFVLDTKGLPSRPVSVKRLRLVPLGVFAGHA